MLFLGFDTTHYSNDSSSVFEMTKSPWIHILVNAYVFDRRLTSWNNCRLMRPRINDCLHNSIFTASTDFWKTVGGFNSRSNTWHQLVSRACVHSEWCVQGKGEGRMEKGKGSILGKHYAVNANGPHHTVCSLRPLQTLWICRLRVEPETWGQCWGNKSDKVLTNPEVSQTCVEVKPCFYRQFSVFTLSVGLFTFIILIPALLTRWVLCLW